MRKICEECLDEAVFQEALEFLPVQLMPATIHAKIWDFQEQMKPPGRLHFWTLSS
jgi:hypothetical protein